MTGIRDSSASTHVAEKFSGSRSGESRIRPEFASMAKDASSSQDVRQEM